jgi:hypothetical protein
VRKRLSPGFAIPYGVAIALAVVLIAFFGWAGFWLGVAIVVSVRATRWGVPLIKLSYAPAPAPAPAPMPAPAQPVDDAGTAAEVEPRLGS